MKRINFNTYQYYEEKARVIRYIQVSIKNIK